MGIPRASVSLDGPTSKDHDAFRGVPGAFESSLNGIEMLRSAGVGVQINTTLTRRNRHQLHEMVSLAERIGRCGVSRLSTGAYWSSPRHVRRRNGTGRV